MLIQTKKLCIHRCVVLHMLESYKLALPVPQIPFHNLTQRVINSISFSSLLLGDLNSWLSKLYRLMSFPLDLRAMPVLRILELGRIRGGIWFGIVGCPGADGILSLLHFLVTQFEQRRVQFIE